MSNKDKKDNIESVPKEIQQYDKMHYIHDRELFSAVCFALHLMRNEGKPMSEALSISSNYYARTQSAIAMELMIEDYIRMKDAKHFDNKVGVKVKI